MSKTKGYYCPFCRSSNAHEYEHETGEAWVVICSRCRATSPYMGSKERVLEIWEEIAETMKAKYERAAKAAKKAGKR